MSDMSEDELLDYDVLVVYSHNSHGEYSSYRCHGMFRCDMKGLSLATGVRKGLVAAGSVDSLEQETSIVAYKYNEYSTGGYVLGRKV